MDPFSSLPRPSRPCSARRPRLERDRLRILSPHRTRQQAKRNARLCFAVLLSSGLLFLPVSKAGAADSSSANYTLRGAGTNGGTTVVATAPSGASSGFTLGRIPTPRPSAGFASLDTVAPGFWPIVRGAYPNLDIDGDGVPAFLDLDDDGDGLDDLVETNTGVFVSAGDTGTDPSLFDSDGDGAGDGDEVNAGFNPNDPDSTPPPPVVPALPWLFSGLLISALGAAAKRQLAGRTKR